MLFFNQLYLLNKEHFISNKNQSLEKPITTALLLAAGKGSRLFPLTKKSPKCLTLVNEISILERLIKSLKQHGFKRLIVVTGHLEECIRNFLETHAGNIKIEYVFSPLYATTNNIYSLWMTRKIIKEPFVLIESDLVFDPSLLTGMLFPDRIAIAKMKPWLNGSTVSINDSKTVEAFHINAKSNSKQLRYKTVNIYSLSVSSWYRVIEKLNLYISKGKVNDYYETVFREMVAEKSLFFKAVFFDNKPWYEIDTMADLTCAEKLFPVKIHKTLSNYGSVTADQYMGKSIIKGSLHAQS